MRAPYRNPWRRLWYAVSLPERGLRALFAGLGGAVHESAQVLLPRFVRGSRLYEATAKNALRIAVEAIGRVEPAEPPEVSAKQITVRKAAGNVVELGSIAAFGFSPLWLLAAAADVTHGSRVYLATFVAELKRAGVLAEEREVGSVDDLLAALEGASGRSARLIDIPPLELAELRATLGEFRADATGLPGPEELASLYRGLREEAARERCSRSRSAWGWRSCSRPGASPTSISRCRTARTGHRSAARASRATPAGSVPRTPGRWPATSTRSARPGRNGCSSSSSVCAEGPAFRVPAAGWKSAGKCLQSQ
jgi:hypothetical protein